MDQAQQTRRPVAQLGAGRDGPRRQRGWVGLVVILVALVIVALLAQSALKGYGLLGGADSAGRATAPAGASSAPGAAAGATPAPLNPMARARALEDQVKRDAQEQEKRIDDSTQ